MLITIKASPDVITKTIRPFQVVGDVRIISFELTYEDIKGQDWDELTRWLRTVIFTRMVK